MGFPAGGARTMTADLTGKLPPGTRRIRITTNLQIYWDNILISRTEARMQKRPRLTPVPLARADLNFHGFPLKIEGQPPGNVKYIYEKSQRHRPLHAARRRLHALWRCAAAARLVDDKFVVFGSGDEVALDFDPAKLPALPRGWVRDYFFVANGYEKDMDFYAYEAIRSIRCPSGACALIRIRRKSFPLDAEHMNYLLEYNTRFMSGNEQRGYWFDYGTAPATSSPGHRPN